MQLYKVYNIKMEIKGKYNGLFNIKHKISYTMYLDDIFILGDKENIEDKIKENLIQIEDKYVKEQKEDKRIKFTDISFHQKYKAATIQECMQNMTPNEYKDVYMKEEK